MKATSSTIIVVALFLAGCAKESPEQPKPGSNSTVADYVFTNGSVYTVNSEQEWADAVAVQYDCLCR